MAIGLNSLKINPIKQHLLAAGDRDGCLHMLELPKNLTRKVANEENILREFFNREMRKDLMNFM